MQLDYHSAFESWAKISKYTFTHAYRSEVILHIKQKYSDFFAKLQTNKILCEWLIKFMRVIRLPGSYKTLKNTIKEKKAYFSQDFMNYGSKLHVTSENAVQNKFF